MRYHIPSKLLRWLYLLGLPLAVLFALIGQSRQNPGCSTRTLAPVTPQANTALAGLSEFQAVTDRTTELGPEEMPAYWRLLNAAVHKSYAELKQQSAPCGDLDHLLEAPAKFRGSPLLVTLNVRRVLSYEVEGGPSQLKRLYEVWGWLDGAPDQLVVVVASELPAGMPIGDTVYERATMCGYFFKLQGYLPAGAEARMSPLAAPLLIGRLEKCPQPQLAFAHDKDWWRIGAGTLLVLSLVGSFSSRFQVKRQTRQSTLSVDTQESAAFDAWLGQSRE